MLSILLMQLPACVETKNNTSREAIDNTPANQANPQLAIPQLRAPVNDYAGVFTKQERAKLNALLLAYQQETTHQVAVLTVPTVKGEPINAFSLRVAKAWGLGRKRIDNGVLLTIATQDRKIRIELGYGMSKYVSDAQAAEIISSTIVPTIQSKGVAAGIEAGLHHLLQACRAYKVAQ